MNKYSSSTSFIDLLFNLLLVFVSLFVLSFILINPQSEQNKIDPNAAFLITISWPGSLNDDVDLWVEDPRGNLVFFNRKEAGLMYLDRDDLGREREVITNDDGAVISVEKNQETVIVRGSMSGEYTINIYMYSKIGDGPVPVMVQVLKINPFAVIHEETIILKEDSEEKTVIKYSLDKDGLVVAKSHAFNSLVKRGRR